MKIIKLTILVVTILITSCSKKVIPNSSVVETTVFQLDFEKSTIGEYSDDNLLKDVGEVRWKLLDNRATIEEDQEHGSVLKVKFPKGTVGPKQGGIQFDKPIPKSTDYYLDYYVKFADGFDFVKGGKLPGLTSGGEKYTGGSHPTKGEGWSARFMWSEGNKIIVYFYHMDMKGRWGDVIYTNKVFTTGKWHRISQHLKMNSGKKFNGIMEVWVDGEKVVDNQKVRYRLAPLGEIDSFYFSTFHGGNTKDWAPKNDSYIYFDDFKVTNTKPKRLE